MYCMSKPAPRVHTRSRVIYGPFRILTHLYDRIGAVISQSVQIKHAAVRVRTFRSSFFRKRRTFLVALIACIANDHDGNSVSPFISTGRAEDQRNSATVGRNLSTQNARQMFKGTEHASTPDASLLFSSSFDFEALSPRTIRASNRNLSIRSSRTIRARWCTLRTCSNVQSGDAIRREVGVVLGRFRSESKPTLPAASLRCAHAFSMACSHRCACIAPNDFR